MNKTVDCVSLEKINSSYHIEEKKIIQVDPTIWAASGIDVAISCLERVQPSLIRVSELFREDVSKGNALLKHCIDCIERFIDAIEITKAVKKLSLELIKTEVGTLAGLEGELKAIINEMNMLQEKENYEELVEKVEYELITNIHSWIKYLKIYLLKEEQS